MGNVKRTLYGITGLTAAGLAWFGPSWIQTLLAAALGLALVLRWHRRTRSRGKITLWGDRSRRNHGVATQPAILRHASWWAMGRLASTVRPSNRGLARRERLVAFMRTRRHAVALCRVGLLRIWSSIEDVTLVFGGPRTGKTGWLAGRIIDSPGTVLVTSTRTDLYDLTSPLRAKQGPIYVFNAVGLGDLPSTITFDPLHGCADPVTAVERATDMISSPGGGDREWWDLQGRRVLAAFMHAAALGGRTMADVQKWIANPDAAQAAVTTFLRDSPEPAYQADVEQFITTNDRTRSSITSTIMPALGWLASPPAREAATGTTPFDVAELIRSKATVYLLGAEETHSAPLVCALTGHIAREARRIATRQPGGRLDPPLALWLDEAALVSPVPLDSWTSDMGGRNVTIGAAFQSRAQLLARWGKDRSAIILNNAGAIMVFGGTKDQEDLSFWSSLAGEHEEIVQTKDGSGKVTSSSTRKTPVMPASQFSTLPVRHVVVFRRGIAPAVGRARMAWKRWDVRLEAFQSARVARAADRAEADLTAPDSALTGQLTGQTAGQALPDREPVTAPAGVGAEVPVNA